MQQANLAQCKKGDSELEQSHVHTHTWLHDSVLQAWDLTRVGHAVPGPLGAVITVAY